MLTKIVHVYIIILNRYTYYLTKPGSIPNDIQYSTCLIYVFDDAVSRVWESMQTLSTYNIFHLVLTLVYLEKKYVVLGNKMDVADILQSMKNGKNIKYLKFRVALDSLKRFGRHLALFPSSAPNKVEKFKLWQ